MVRGNLWAQRSARDAAPKDEAELRRDRNRRKAKRASRGKGKRS